MFLQFEVPYLGHVVSRSGITPDPKKVDKVRNYPIPTNPTKVRQFLDLASYYRFVKEFSKIASPLYSKEAPFQWTLECQQAFESFKCLLVTVPILAYPQFGEKCL